VVVVTPGRGAPSPDDRRHADRGVAAPHRRRRQRGHRHGDGRLSGSGLAGPPDGLTRGPVLRRDDSPGARMRGERRAWWHPAGARATPADGGRDETRRVKRNHAPARSVSPRPGRDELRRTSIGAAAPGPNRTCVRFFRARASPFCPCTARRARCPDSRWAKDGSRSTSLVGGRLRGWVSPAHAGSLPHISR